MNHTTRFELPLLAAGQAQKELFHNEALSRVDTLLHPCIEALAIDVPPSAPVAGQCWIVGTAPSGDWSGHGGELAQWTEGGWRFVTPREGLKAMLRDSGEPVVWRDGVWRHGLLIAREVHVEGRRVIGSRQPAITAPADGGNVDDEARAAIGAILIALRSHGLIES